MIAHFLCGARQKRIYQHGQVGGQLQAKVQAVVNQLLCLGVLCKAFGNNPGFFFLHVFIALSCQVDYFKQGIAEFILFQLSSTFGFACRYHAASASFSSSAFLCSGGTLPLQSLCISTKVRLIKLPKIFTSSLLFLSWNSFQVKSLSLVSGALAQSTYRKASCCSGKILQVVIHPNRPVAAGRYFIAFNIQKFVGRHIVRQYKIAMCFQHGRENNAMENNIVFTNKMHQFGIILTPVICPVFGQFFGGRDITDGRIKPNIQYFSFCTFGQGTFMPQLLSRVMARVCRPLSSQLLHCPYTLFFHSVWSSTIHSFSQAS